MMLNENFCHLHVHNEYSLLDGYGTAEQYAERAAELGFKYIALTNHGNVDGCLKWQRACDRAGISPVVGAELYLVENASIKRKGEDRRHIVILVKNETGWQQLCALITKANLEGYYGKPRIDYNMLLNCDMSGWVVMTACIGSFLNDIRDPFSSKFDIIDQMRQQTDVYYEIMPHCNEEQLEFHRRMEDIATLSEHLPLVATIDAHYIMAEDVEVQSVMLAIARNVKWKDPKRWAMDDWDLHLYSAQEMEAAFSRQNYWDRVQYLKAMRNTVTIAKQCCGFRIERKRMSLPVPLKYKEIKNFKCGLQLETMVEAGLVNANLDKNKEYRNRVEEEIDLIRFKGFSRYFLIVSDIVDWCREEGIAVGPGRGSVGGSLVAFLLGITQVDPIKYDLLFSRFITEERIDYPDIDLDFEKSKRHLVIKYLKETYGRYNVAGISTFGKLHGRGAIRDIGRIFELPLPEVDRFAKAIPYGSDSGAVAKAVESGDNNDFCKRYPKEVAYAIRLDGQIRNQGQHAAGMIISGEDLRDGERCCLRKAGEDLVINWDMDDAEHNGLIKLDILGLSTLSVLSEAERLIRRQDPNFECGSIPLDDAETFKTISDLRLAGLFQLTGSACTGVIKEMGVESLEDIAAIIALARPGPLGSGMAGQFIKRKTGRVREWETINPIYAKVTHDTYGILVYQEQVMQVISRVAGLSESTADKIRKIIAKKHVEDELQQYWQMFLEGCEKNNTFTEPQAELFWKELQSWAGYGFNKAHAVAYALIGYWTAYLKTHYPQEFYCAVLTYGDVDDDKQALIDEIRERGWRVMPPKIDHSSPCNWVVKEGTFYMPFTELKGMGESGANKLFECSLEQKASSLRGFFDMEEVVTKPQVTKQTKALLECVGAYDPEAIPEDIDRHLDFCLSQVWSADYIKNKRWHINEVVECTRCKLEQECRSPIPTTLGQTNVFILGEAPGREEDKQGKPFIGPAGAMLWNRLGESGYTRRFFHVTNACRCYPRQTRTPAKQHIKACWPWTAQELAETECRLVLALGNIAQYALTDRSGGIERLSGTTEYLSELGLWVCWCVHPASVLRQRSDKKMQLFKDGIANFLDMLKKVKEYE